MSDRLEELEAALAELCHMLDNHAAGLSGDDGEGGWLDWIRAVKLDPVTALRSE